MREDRCGFASKPRLLIESEEVIHMIEAVLLEIIYLLLFGLIAEFICVFALIIAVIILSK